MSRPYAPLYAGMAYALPLLLWLLPGMESAESPEAIRRLGGTGLGVLVLIQALALAGFLPLASRRESVRGAITDLAVLLAVPLPLGVALVLGGGAGWGLFVGSQSLLLLGGVALALGLRMLLRLPVPGARALAPPLIQIALLALVVVAGGPWLDRVAP